MLLQGRSEIISGSNAKAYIECSMSSSRVSFMLNATYPNSLNLKNTELEPTPRYLLQRILCCSWCLGKSGYTLCTHC